MNRIILLLSLILLSLLSSCQEEVGLETPTLPSRLVVDGHISSEFKRHEVRLSLSGDYRRGEAYESVSGAAVTISDGESVFILEEKGGGLYQTDSLAGMPGRVYTLRIEWDAERFEASDTMSAIPSSFPPVSFANEGNFRTMEYRRHQFGFPEANRWQVIVGPPDTLLQPVYTSTLGQQVGVEVDTTGAYTFNYFTHPTIEVNGLMNFEEAHFYGFRLGRTVTQKRYSLSESYYQYLRALFSETDWRGTLFDSTPGPVTGNVSNGGLGFFSAQAVRVVRFEI
ncbi:MAG: DUF4249 domain-containing protein [Phaeodactylibacter sp.]|nr:DUF4249 domain-containing protein [Phaeodactylibacter sp.]MCB9293711.1 DUF4249 domain-containing protein [Lewinellaceae bacterium]